MVIKIVKLMYDLMTRQKVKHCLLYLLYILIFTKAILFKENQKNAIYYTCGTSFKIPVFNLYVSSSRMLLNYLRTQTMCLLLFCNVYNPCCLQCF